MGLFSKKKAQASGRENSPPDAPETAGKAGKRPLSASAEENVAIVLAALGGGDGLVVKRHVIFKEKHPVCLVYLDSMADKKAIGEQLLRPLLEKESDAVPAAEDILGAVAACVSFSSAVETAADQAAVLRALTGGKTALFAQGVPRVLIFDTGAPQHRPVEKPENEAVMMGGQESLTENLAVNCSLIAKRLQNPDLKYRAFTVGKLSQTALKLLWIEGVAIPEVVEEAAARLGRIDTDIIDGIGDLAELIRDSPLSIFPTNKQTQRPDTVARNLADGQFAILCDNSPYAFVAPCSFWDQIKTADDYAQSTFISTYLRLIRYLSFVICTTISALYLACVTYNHDIVPPKLATAIAIGRSGVPFPSLLEILLLTIAISIIREASLRIPGSTGYFIGTMSAIVIGQAAVSAGYVSASVIIVISISVIASYAVSSSPLLYTTRLINYFLVLMAGFSGMFGMINGIIFILWRMISLRSFGLPYLYPMVPFDRDALKDTVIKAPAKSLTKRFRLLSPANRTRTGQGGTAQRRAAPRE